MKNILFVLALAMSAVNIGFAGGGQLNSVVNESLLEFLHSTEGSYGWQPFEGEISYDFFRDGRLHIQGEDGEATMWQGVWTLTGNQLTLVNSDLQTSKTVTAVKDGEDLLLNGQRYYRYTL